MKFNKPLGTWIDEEVSVKSIAPEMSEDGKVSFVEKEIKGTQKTMYVDPPKRTVVCPRGKHDFFPHTPSKGLFACRKCDYRFKTYPVTHEYFEDSTGGHLRHKITGVLV